MSATAVEAFLPTLTAAGATHTLAVNADGTVSAWGDNSYGELGDGTTTERTSAVVVQGLSAVTAVVQMIVADAAIVAREDFGDGVGEMGA